MVAATHARTGPPAAKEPASPAMPGPARGPAHAANADSALWRAVSLGVRPKLEVSSPADPEEREADRVADQVMRMPAGAPAVGAAIGMAAVPRVQRACAACEKEEEEAASGRVARQHDGSAAATNAGSIAPPVGGRPLGQGERAFFEPRFGTDFSDVRIHADAGADHAARQLNARAFALGPHLSFAAGAYAPHEPSGARLHSRCHDGILIDDGQQPLRLCDQRARQRERCDCRRQRPDDGHRHPDRARLRQLER